MRLDLFLKASRLCPRRSVAQKLCEAGSVMVGARQAKPAHLIRPGDEITIFRRDRKTTVLVKALPQGRQTSRAESSSLFDLMREEIVDPDDSYQRPGSRKYHEPTLDDGATR